jgi:hypothetical protein
MSTTKKNDLAAEVTIRFEEHGLNYTEATAEDAAGALGFTFDSMLVSR